MAKEEKKSVALELSVYIELSKLAADLRSANPAGGFVSMSDAVGVLLDERETNSKTIQNLMEQLAHFEGGADWEPHNETK